MSKTVFITGATGYIGGATLAHLLSAQSTKSFSYSALVRSKEKAALLESLGIHPVLGTIDDTGILTAEAAKSDIVIHTANSADHVPSTKALLEGLKKRGNNSIYIHVSGTAVLVDGARGEYASNEIFSDLDPDHINALPDTAFHRNVDLEILSASDEVRTHIVLPPLIYGIADHALVRKHVSNPVSIAIPMLIRNSLDRKQAGTIGSGLNIWPNVHISDAASGIAAVLEGALIGKTATGREGYYFQESGEHTAYDVAAEIGRVLNAKGLAKAEPAPFTEEELQKYFGSVVSYILGGNARCTSNRTRQLGWNPTHTTVDLIASIGPEIDYILKERGQ